MSADQNDKLPQTMEEALRWYADPANWKRQAKGNNKRCWLKPSTDIDKGAMARFFLSLHDKT